MLVLTVCFGALLLTTPALVASIKVDMEGPACLEYEPYIVHDYVTYNVEAYPTQNQIQTTSSCTVKFRPADPSRRFRIYVNEIGFGDCGIFIKIFDGDVYLKTPRWTLNCDTQAGKRLEDTQSENLAIRLEKQSSDSTNQYRFRLTVTTNIGDYLNGYNPPDEVLSNNELTAGAQAGIGVAIGLVVLIVVVLAILFIIRWMRNKKERAQSLTTIYTSTASQSSKTKTPHNENANKMAGSKCAYINSTWSTRDVPGKTTTEVSPPTKNTVYISSTKKKEDDLQTTSSKQSPVLKVRYSDQNGVKVSSTNKSRDKEKSKSNGMYEKKGSVRSQRSIGKSAGRSSSMSEKDRHKRDETDTARHVRSESQERDRRSRSDKFAYDNKTFEDERLYDLNRKSRSGSSRSRNKSPSRGGSRDGSSTTDHEQGVQRHHGHGHVHRSNSGSRRSRSSSGAHHGGHHQNDPSGTHSSHSGRRSHGRARSRSPGSSHGHSRSGHVRSRSPGSGSRHNGFQRSRGRSSDR